MNINDVPWLAPDTIQFPDVSQALSDPNGLLALGGDLQPQRIIAAYQQGIFPWYSDDQPIMWWSPDPRLVLFLEQFKVSRSLQKNIHNKDYRVTFNLAFEEVVFQCSEPRGGEFGTWITPAMFDAYYELHAMGRAHSVEVWHDELLVGGLYGVDNGKVFCGESMFSRVADASKIALYHLVQRLIEMDYVLIDCQVTSEHLVRLGATEIARDEFVRILKSGDNTIHNWNDQ